MREGGCLCGAVRYRVEGEPDSTGFCHCRTCRRVASAPTLPFSVVPAAAFSITQGSPVDYRSSPPVTRSFCGRCGSPLTYRSTLTPETIDVMTCSLDDPDTAPPSFHVWTSHKLDWDRIADDLPAASESRTSSSGADDRSG